MLVQRQTACKLWISNLIKGKYHKEEGEFGLNYVLINDKKIARVNLIATFVDIYKNDAENYIIALLDDGFGSVRCKNWNEDLNLYKNVGIGNVVLVIGKVREQNGEIYIVPEILKVIDSIWAKVRNSELKKKYGEPEKIEFNADVKEPEIVEEIVSSESDRQRILSLIERNDSLDGIDYDDLILKSGLKEEIVKDIINDLIKQGEIFEPKSGRLKILG